METFTYEVIGPDGTKFKFEALPDGRVKLTTGNVGAVVHTNAEGMVKMLNGLLGGEAKREARGDHEHSHHTHTHAHHHEV